MRDFILIDGKLINIKNIQYVKEVDYHGNPGIQIQFVGWAYTTNTFESIKEFKSYIRRNI